MGHTFFSFFSKMKVVKIRASRYKKWVRFSNPDVTRFQIFSQTMSYRYIMA